MITAAVVVAVIAVIAALGFGLHAHRQQLVGSASGPAKGHSLPSPGLRQAEADPTSLRLRAKLSGCKGRKRRRAIERMVDNHLRSNS
jgi:hypothetical protein